MAPDSAMCFASYSHRETLRGGRPDKNLRPVVSIPGRKTDLIVLKRQVKSSTPDPTCRRFAFVHHLELLISRKRAEFIQVDESGGRTARGYNATEWVQPRGIIRCFAGHASLQLVSPWRYPLDVVGTPVTDREGAPQTPTAIRVISLTDWSATRNPSRKVATMP
jgi:hypothetical protein